MITSAVGSCRLLAEEGGERSAMRADLLLLRSDQQLAVGKVPDVEAEEVEPVIDMDDAGLGFAQLQPAAGEERGQSRDDVVFEHLPRRGGDHEVVGIPDEVDASIASFAAGRG